MAFEAFNADGDPIEGVLPPEEITTLQQQLVETNEKLSKLENKDFNFRKLEQMTDDEKSKLSATELSLKQKAEELEAQQKDFSTSFINDIKNDVLEKIVGDDADLRAKVELNYNRLKDTDSAKTRGDIDKLMREAYTLSIGNKGTNQLNAAFNATGSAPVKAANSGKLSDDAIAVGRKMGLSDADLGLK